MSIEQDARAEAEKRWPSNHIVDDPLGETGYAESDPYGYNDTAQAGFREGAEWQASRPVTDEQIEGAARAIFEESQELDQENDWDDPLPDEWREEWRYIARAALEAARALADKETP